MSSLLCSLRFEANAGGGGGELATGGNWTPQFWQNISPGIFE
jgi:hypothetical protein